MMDKFTKEGATFKCGKMFLVLCFILAVIGIPLIVLGVLGGKAHDKLDADSDFNDLGLACNITSVDLDSISYETSVKKKNRKTLTKEDNCRDEIKGRFVVCDLDAGFDCATEYKSEKSEKVRCTDCQCSSTTPWALYVPGELVTCWAPSGDASDVPSAYDCPNDDCVKLLDPQDEQDSVAAGAMGALIVGVIFLLLAVAVAGAASHQFFLANARDEENGGETAAPGPQQGVLVEIPVKQPQEQSTFELMVPDGSGPGMLLTLQAPNGVSVSVTVPEGMQPGMVMQVAMPMAV